MMNFSGAVDITLTSRGVQVPATVHLPALKAGEKAPFVVFAHGHGGSRKEGGFLAIAQKLKEKGIASITVDFPGCGDSAEPFRENTLPNMKQDILAALRYMVSQPMIDAQRAGIFGYSMGGRLTLELLAERAYGFLGAALLAPAGSTRDLKDVFGGAENYENLRNIAGREGFASFTSPFGQIQELSRAWFAALDQMPENAADLAAANFTGKALVFYGEDDHIVHAPVCLRVAEALGAEAVNVSGDRHAYGFYGAAPEIIAAIASRTADFFAGVFAV